MKNILVLDGKKECAYEVQIQYKRPLFNKMIHIQSSKDIHALMRDYIADLDLDFKEYIWLICLSRANKVLSVSCMGKGTVEGVAVSVSEIIQIALLVHASGVVLVHNHPSGALKPSTLDKYLTKKVMLCASLYDILLLDHMILTTESYLSMADDCIMPIENIKNYFKM